MSHERQNHQDTSMGMTSTKERLLKWCCRLIASNNTEHEPAAIFDRD
jgi:hypothetical protein